MKSPVYLYTGPEFGQKNDAIDAVKKSLEQKFGDIDNHLFYLIEEILYTRIIDYP